MCLTCHIRVEHFFGALKKKIIYTKYINFYKKELLKGLLNLGAQIRSAQNRYIDFQIDLKYPLGLDEKA